MTTNIIKKTTPFLIFLAALLPSNSISQPPDSSISMSDSLGTHLDSTELKQSIETKNIIYHIIQKEENKGEKLKKKSLKSTSEIIPLYIPLINTFLWLIFLLIIFFLGKDHIIDLFKSLAIRIKQGSEVSIGPISVGKDTFVTKTADLQKESDKVKIYGNPDNFQLLFKVDTGSMKKSTKAMKVDGGCIIQVSTELKNPDGSWSVAEALTFAPKAKIIKNEEGLEGFHIK